MFSDCKEDCILCRIYGSGGCLAGHGDDDFCWASKEVLFKRLEANPKEKEKILYGLKKKYKIDEPAIKHKAVSCYPVVELTKSYGYTKVDTSLYKLVENSIMEMYADIDKKALQFLIDNGYEDIANRILNKEITKEEINKLKEIFEIKFTDFLNKNAPVNLAYDMKVEFVLKKPKETL